MAVHVTVDELAQAADDRFAFPDLAYRDVLGMAFQGTMSVTGEVLTLSRRGDATTGVPPKPAPCPAMKGAVVEQ